MQTETRVRVGTSLYTLAMAALVTQACTPDTASATDPAVAEAPAAAHAGAAGGEIDMPAAALQAQRDGSGLSFFAVQADAEFEGRFERFDARVFVDEERPERSRIVASIELDSVKTDNEERDEALVSADFFATDKWPNARYIADTVRSTADGYVAEGRLTLRDQTRPVLLRFTYTARTETTPARLVGDADIKRLHFGVGQGEWTDTEWVADDVRIAVDLRLQ